ncbi:MAG: spore coat associated protein CotJA [Firmicutes bacterium]|nr:spore coat associated protein CotJA [Bacillota bacterium]
MAECKPYADITNVMLAQAYVPYQRICTLMEPVAALKAGTVFPELVDVYK